MDKRTRSEVTADAAELEDFVNDGVTTAFAKVVQKVHKIDFEAEYDALIKHMEPDPARMEFSTAYAYADAAESRSRRALQLMAVARLEQKSFKFEKEKIEAAWRQEANAVLQGEKDAGLRSKQITDSDIRAQMVALYGDKLSALEERAQKIENTVDVLTELVKVAASRCKAAQTMLSTVRK